MCTIVLSAITQLLISRRTSGKGYDEVNEKDEDDDVEEDVCMSLCWMPITMCGGEHVMLIAMRCLYQYIGNADCCIAAGCCCAKCPMEAMC